MKKITFTIMLTLLSVGAYAQKTNLDKLPEKERNEYLLKVAYATVMQHAPGWYRDYRAPEIKTIIHEFGPNRGELIYGVAYLNDPSKEYMENGFAVAVTIYAETGRPLGISFGDGVFYYFNATPSVRSANDADKPYFREYIYYPPRQELEK